MGQQAWKVTVHAVEEVSSTAKRTLGDLLRWDKRCRCTPENTNFDEAASACAYDLLRGTAPA